MNTSLTPILAWTYIAIIICILLKCFFNKNKALIWHPIVFFCLYNIYYVVIPYLIDAQRYDIQVESAIPYLLTGSLLNIVFLCVGYKLSRPCDHIYKFNDYIPNRTTPFIAMSLFAFAFLCNVVVNGFSLNISYSENVTGMFSSKDTYDSYIRNLVSLFPLCACLFYVARKQLKWNLFFWGCIIIALLLYLIAGFRFRIALMFVIIGTFYHLYNGPKKINYKIWIPIFLIFYISMGIIEHARQYGKGLDMSRVSLNKYESAGEGDGVYVFSAKVMEVYDTKERLYFEPLLTAICMPIPRAIFPWKPDAQYLRDTNDIILGFHEGGAAFVWIAEAFMSFGWLGIIINGLFVGWLCRKFWSNYKHNPQSIGAIFLLASFNAVLYIMVSRGYSAQILMNFIYYIFVPFWLIRLLRKLFPNKFYSREIDF